MPERSSERRNTGLALVRLAWPQLLTLFCFLIAVGLRYPAWFVILVGLVECVSLRRFAQNVADGPTRSSHMNLMDWVLIGSGWASILLSTKWWIAERAQQLAPGATLTSAGYHVIATDPELVWSSIMTQWSSCAVFLVIVLAWAFSGRHTDVGAGG
ncbi:hypothetical protein [Paraburkholderia sp.]|uniref:hypothetical protein n=1 Tax=Paraburkholderia sp. TaxID=1926495 RepID=UPI003D6FFEBC